MHKILVIEDEKSVLQNTLDILKLEGFDVFGAPNGRIGVACVDDYAPDLIICDISMPEMDGYDVLAALRLKPVTALTPFIFLTARTERSDVRHGMNLGADDYLTKPFRVSELLASVYARLDRKSAVQEQSDQRLNSLREQIVLSMPHELRTPLTSILGFSDLLILDAETMAPEQISRMARHINDAGSRLSRLVENYLTYAQIEIIQLDPDRMAAMQTPGKKSTDKLVESTLQQLNQRWNRPEDLRVNMEPAVLKVRDDIFRKIAEELIDNAFKFSKPGQLITVDGGVMDKHYKLVVTDHGRGMTALQISQIGAYMQFDRARHEQQGMGLGLIISRRLAELYQGSLIVESKPDVETTVQVILPIS